jgi:long-chain acyl-CoA synthetase
MSSAAEPALSIAEVEARLTAPGSSFEMEEVEIRGLRTRVWKRAIPTLRHLTERMRDHGERIFVVYEDDRLSYAEAYGRVAALAHYLRDRCGVRQGDRVALAMRNYPEWPLAFYAVTSLGAIVVPLNAWWKREELEYGISDSGSRVLIADRERPALLEPSFSKLSLEHVIVAKPADRLPSGAVDFALAASAGRPDLRLPDATLHPDDDATIFYTSGTTGNPKGALGTHRNLLTNITSAGFAQARGAMRRGEGEARSEHSERSADAPQAAAGQRSILMSVPFFHVTGSHSTMAANTAAGNKLVLMHRWNPERALELIERERVNQFGGVPSMVWQVLESPDLLKRDTSSVMGVGYGGAPASPELVRRIHQHFGTITSSNGYGMTETSAISTINNSIDYIRKPDSIGRPVAVVDVKVIDAAGRTLPCGEIGELCIRGPNIVRGYWNKPEATAATFRDGWCHSGDIARIDAEGFVYIVDRAKDMLIRGGENVYCVEVEDVLYSHPAVMDAAVVGIPHQVLGEEVGAVVQVTSGAAVSEGELQAYVAERLARFKVPVRIDLRLEPLPRNANGKILKRELREAMAASKRD